MFNGEEGKGLAIRGIKRGERNRGTSDKIFGPDRMTQWLNSGEAFSVDEVLRDRI